MVNGIGASKGYSIGKACIINHALESKDECLKQKFNSVCKGLKDVIIVTDELSIKEINQINDKNIVGLVMEKGSVTSHATIVAKTLGIPLVVGAYDACKKIKDGKTVIVDGIDGKILYDPDNKLVDYFSEKKKLYDKQNNFYKMCHMNNEKIN